MQWESSITNGKPSKGGTHSWKPMATRRLISTGEEWATPVAERLNRKAIRRYGRLFWGLYLYSTATVLKLEGALESPRGSVKTLIVGPTPRISGSGSRWGQKICTSNKFPAMLLLLIWAPHIENHWTRDTELILKELPNFFGDPGHS